MLTFDRTSLGVDRPVLWTRGRGCRELAEVLSDVEPVRVTDQLAQVCIDHRAELLVSRRLSTAQDLVNRASPVDFDTGKIDRVVAAVGGGPHSVLAAEVAARVGEVLGLHATMISAYREPSGQGGALQAIEAIADRVPTLEYRLVEAAKIADLSEHLDEGTLVVLGASGGSWFQRLFFGPGAKLRSEAEAGAVVVRSAPRRVFQVMEPPVFVGPLLQVDDVRRTMAEPVVAIVDRGVLQGIVVLDDLDRARGDESVGSFAVPFDGIDVMAPVADLPASTYPGAALPVVSEDGRLVGAFRR